MVGIELEVLEKELEQKGLESEASLVAVEVECPGCGRSSVVSVGGEGIRNMSVVYCWDYECGVSEFGILENLVSVRFKREVSE